jgi:cytochrome c-type biogenesis protein CcmH/NrfF
MAKKKPSLNVKCPQCQDEDLKLPRVDITAASNVTVLQCMVCDWEFAKDQSVKISGNLVRLAAEAMYIHEGYSSLGEYVRDCVRRHSEFVFTRAMNEQSTDLLKTLIDNPEKIDQLQKMLSEEKE